MSRLHKSESLYLFWLTLLSMNESQLMKSLRNFPLAIFTTLLRDSFPYLSTVHPRILRSQWGITFHFLVEGQQWPISARALFWFSHSFRRKMKSQSDRPNKENSASLFLAFLRTKKSRSRSLHISRKLRIKRRFRNEKSSRFTSR